MENVSNLLLRKKKTHLLLKVKKKIDITINLNLQTYIG